MSAVPSLNEAIALESLKVEIILPPRLARRLRALSYDKRTRPSQVAAYLLVAQLVHDDGERRRLIALDAVHDVRSDRDD